MMKKEQNTDLIKDFGKFLPLLETELENLKKIGKFSEKGKVSEFVNRLKEMVNTKFIPQINKTIRLDPNIIKQELGKILDPYFDSFETKQELLADLKENSGAYFSFEKAYQMSHVRGVFTKNIDGSQMFSTDIQNYYLSRLFIDCYESLLVILRPVLLFHWGKEKKGEKFPTKRTSEQYRFLEKQFPQGPFKILQISEKYNELRNKFSHSKVLFREDKIIFWDLENAPSSISPLDVYPILQTMIDLLVIFTTEMDIRILRLAKPENDVIFQSWIEYFENYVYWFLKLS